MSPRGVIKVNQFLRAVCLDIVGKADFSLDLDAVAKPDQKVIKRYLHAFDVGEQSPVFLKLLQVCPVALQLPATTIVSKLIDIDISLMRGIIEASVATKLKTLQGENSGARISARDGQEDLLQRICSRSQIHLSERALSRHALTALAGSVEMVSNQLAWALYALSLPRNQHIQEKLRDEILSHFPTSPESLTWEELRDMPYLTGVVNETLRLFPSVAHRFRVCNTSTKLLGRNIRKGTMIVWPTYAVNRRPDLWGNDADVFRPERWNESNGIDGNDGKRDAYAFMTFGQGPRKCPGEHYTRVVMACVLLMFVGRFRFTMAPGHGDVLEGDKKPVKFGIVMKAPIYVQVEEIPSWCRFRDADNRSGSD